MVALIGRESVPVSRSFGRPGRVGSGVAVVLLAGALTAVLVAASSHRPQPAPRGIDIALIGDSLSTGLATPGDPWTRDAQALLAARRQPVRFLSAAENGAGYVTPGNAGDTFLDEATKVVDARVPIVVVFGSDNDLGQPDLAEGAAATLRWVRAAAPQARLVVIGPPAPPAQQPAQLAPIRDALRAAAAQVSGQFVDPLALGWFQGPSSLDVGPDEEHPNEAGEQFLATRMADLLAPLVAAAARR